MSQGLINFIIWIPFLVVFAVYGALYAASGYKKGVYRALISVGATVVAGLISAILAKLIAPPIANSVYNALNLSSSFGQGIYANFAEIFSKSIIQSIMTMVIFSLVIFVFTIVLKVIASKLSEGKFEPRNNGMRWGGFSIRIAEAFIFSLILLLPFYGTLAAYSPMVESLYDLSVTVKNSDSSSASLQDDEAKMLLSTVNGNAIVKIVKATPVQGIYNSLSTSTVNDMEINVPEMVSTCETVVLKVERLMSLPEEEQWAAAEELIVYAEKNIVPKPWLYDVYNIGKDEVVKLINDQSNEFTAREKQLIDEVISSFDIPKKDLNYCMKEGLSFMKFVLQNRYIQRLSEGTITEEQIFTDEKLLQEIGALVNCSEAVLPMKRIVYLGMAYSLTDDYAEAARFIDRHPVKIYNDAESQKKEAESMLFATSGLKLIAAEGFVRHPAFGFEAVEKYVTVYDFAELLYGLDNNNPDEHPVVKFLNSNPDIYNGLLNKLRECEDTPFEGDYFHDYAWTVVHEHLSDYNIGGYNAVSGEGSSSFTYEVVPGTEGGYVVKYYG